MKTIEKSSQINPENYLQKLERQCELRIKSDSEPLDKNEFDELLSLDFEERLDDNPPIEGVFSPEEELKRIKILPREQKREALDIFKENLAKQREGLATCRVFIERIIEFNHDVPKENLEEWIGKFSEQYGFTEEQRGIAEELIDSYYENREKVLEMRQRFPNDNDLIYVLTGIKFNKSDKLDVSVGPMTIDIDAEGFNVGRMYERTDKPVASINYGGFTGQSNDIDPVFYVVINTDKWMRTVGFDDPTAEKSRKHEYEHHKNGLFRMVFEKFKFNSWDFSYSDYDNEKDTEIKRTILEEFFNIRREDALDKAKDEITASLYDRDLSMLQRQVEQFFFSEEKEYDYLEYLRDDEDRKDDVLYQELVRKMLVQEYRTIIEKAVGSYAKLVEKGGYSTQAATALLTDMPLQKWPKTIKRFLEQKLKN